jgi:hypothetical protein
MEARRGASLSSLACSTVERMATLPQAASTSPSQESFLASARTLGALITSETIVLEREGRLLHAVWLPPGKSTPPRVRFTTLAGPLAQPPVIGPLPAPSGGPFRAGTHARIESPAPLTLRFESKLDRIGKWLRINRETQTGDPSFDDRVYLESEAPDALVLAALVDRGTRAGVVACLTLGCASLTLDDAGYLGAEIALTNEASVAPESIATVLDTLAATAEGIPPLQGRGHHRSRVGVIPTIAVLGTLLSWPLFYLVDWIWEPLGSDLYATAMLGGLLLWVLLLPILFITLRGRSVSLRDFLMSAIFLALGLPLGGADLLLTLNGLLDSSAPSAHVTQVKKRRHTTGRNSSSHVTLDSWHEGEQTIEIKIGDSLYDELPPGQAVTVMTRRGFLGWERITAITPSTSRQTSR